MLFPYSHLGLLKNKSKQSESNQPNWDANWTTKESKTIQDLDSSSVSTPSENDRYDGLDEVVSDAMNLFSKVHKSEKDIQYSLKDLSSLVSRVIFLKSDNLSHHVGNVVK